MKRGGLGRGLSSLIPGAAEEGGLLEVPVSAIQPNPRQPRVDFPEESLAATLIECSERDIFDVLVQREKLGSTAIGNGIAIPHGKLAKLSRIFG